MYKECNIISDERKKITFILKRLTPGGAERVLITLMNNIDHKKYEIDFICITGEGTIAHWIDKDIKIHNLNAKNSIHQLWALYKKLKELNPDTVVSTLVKVNADILLLKPLFPKTRFLVRESSLPKVMTHSYGFKSIICSLTYKWLYPKADLVVTPSKQIEEQFKNDIGIDTSNHATLYNPVNETNILSTISDVDEEAAKHTDYIKFVCVGRLGYEKGYDRLIEALEGFKSETGLQWYLEIIGKGEKMKELGTLIRKKNLQDHIRLGGYYNAPWRFMAEADCLLLPSRWEGMPNVVLESLTCGTRVIAHKDAGGVNEIAELTGEGDVQIADTMESFVQAMAKIQPQPHKLPIESRLPQEFALKKVIERFETFL